jgi:hypothetical protein
VRLRWILLSRQQLAEHIQILKNLSRLLIIIIIIITEIRRKKEEKDHNGPQVHPQIHGRHERYERCERRGRRRRRKGTSLGSKT